MAFHAIRGRTATTHALWLLPAAEVARRWSSPADMNISRYFMVVLI